MFGLVDLYRWITHYTMNDGVFPKQDDFSRGTDDNLLVDGFSPIVTAESQASLDAVHELFNAGATRSPESLSPGDDPGVGVGGIELFGLFAR